MRCIHLHYTTKYGFNRSKKLKTYKVEKVISNEKVKIKSDTPILTECHLDHNKPDIMIHDTKAKEIILIEVGITNKSLLIQTEVTKSRKYEMLANELKCLYPGTSVNIIPVVLTWDGIVTKFFRRYMEEIGLNKNIQAYLQTVTLKRTLESILIDCKVNERTDWIDQELNEKMAKLEDRDGDSIIL